MVMVEEIFSEVYIIPTILLQTAESWRKEIDSSRRLNDFYTWNSEPTTGQGQPILGKELRDSIVWVNNQEA